MHRKLELPPAVHSDCTDSIHHDAPRIPSTLNTSRLHHLLGREGRRGVILPTPPPGATALAMSPAPARSHVHLSHAPPELCWVHLQQTRFFPERDVGAYVLEMSERLTDEAIVARIHAVDSRDSDDCQWQISSTVETHWHAPQTYEDPLLTTAHRSPCKLPIIPMT